MAMQSGPQRPTCRFVTAPLTRRVIGRDAADIARIGAGTGGWPCGSAQFPRNRFLPDAVPICRNPPYLAPLTFPQFLLTRAPFDVFFADYRFFCRDVFFFCWCDCSVGATV